jgi:UDP-glucose 4-epimerase
MSRRPEWWMRVLAKTFHMNERIIRSTRLPIIGRVVDWLLLLVLSGKNFNITYLPINKKVEGAGSTYIPIMVLEELIRSASHRAIIKRCNCRDGNNCKEHKVELACLLLGDGAAEIDTGVSVHASAEDTIAHARACIDNGLVPFVGRFKLDNMIWGVKDRGRLLTICFCCRCCCVIMNNKSFMPLASQDSIVKLRGLSMQVDPERCKGCKVCKENCFAGAIDFVDGFSTICQDRCKGCGQCEALCPEKAITASVASVDEAVEEVFGRIGSIINYR